MSPVLKASEMTNDDLLYYFELWARGRKNVDTVKAEILRRISCTCDPKPLNGEHWADCLSRVAERSE